jgi:O-antigen/teichoic acid export membrane protein
MLVAFFLSPILVRGLGDRRYGLWSLVESVLAYLTLFDFGVAASVVRYVAKFEALRDRTNLNRVFSTSLCIFAVAGSCVLALSCGLAQVGPSVFSIPPDLEGEMQWMLRLLGINLTVGLVMSVFHAVLDGLGRYPTKVIIRISTTFLVRIPLFLAVVWSGGGLIELAWAVTACHLIDHGLIAVAAFRYLPQLRFSFALVDGATFRSIRGYSLDAFIALLAGRISFQTDAVVIGTSLHPEHITFFAVAARLVECCKDSIRVVTAVLTPAVSALEAQGNKQAIQRVLLESTRYVFWLILPVQIGLLVLGKLFLHLWIGAPYPDLSYPTLCILALPLAWNMSVSVSARILYGMGQLRWYARAVMIEAVANLVLSVALVRPLGIEGVAWGTAVPNLAFSLCLAVYICRVLGIGLGRYLRQSFLGPCLLGLPLAGAWLITVPQIAPSWLGLLSVGSVGLAAYLTSAALMEFGWTAVLRPVRGFVKQLTGDVSGYSRPGTVAQWRTRWSRRRKSLENKELSAPASSPASLPLRGELAPPRKSQMFHSKTCTESW